MIKINVGDILLWYDPLSICTQNEYPSVFILNQGLVSVLSDDLLACARAGRPETFMSPFISAPSNYTDTNG